MKGLIPAAGKGTRMEPFTNAYPKELLPVGEKAVIEHCIEDMKHAGITDIVIVVGWKQHAILDYLGSGDDYGVQLTYVVQDDRNGLAGAVKAGEHVVGEESFAVVLGDNYVDDKKALKDLVEFHSNKEFDTTIGTFRPDDVTSYGVLDVDEDNRVKGMVEKPSEDEAPSDIAISGMYVFEPEIFNAIEDVEKGKGGEYQLTDAIDILRQRNDNVGYRDIIGTRIDVGTPERLRKANREFDLRDN
ncbi:Nucleotidyltransferase, glucose-1-phosphate thymidylyltransferase [Candidatus Nanohalovita haloferacivicina]|nr:Nucleotidyltransferase, glucose-1-phosphate thymidylyltransferase [Candidatus Nanohalobia archaeon BNXNv]